MAPAERKYSALPKDARCIYLHQLAAAALLLALAVSVSVPR
ncbi:hypothetical protein FHS16_005361 [Paenibacillus endophyticus]|uniref:Uncharacterized protein n=1 Tax=Paenibacillus endophyticus TaxID=1294268 RepID=A0A7W5CCL2_9BACL|nr:hypothetical protein [Paenibacillus endophyticus]MBB3155253.1 hypothetical protein [Paenibacillus endophyticus]